MTVLFASSRPLGRAENIKAVYNAYGGSKAFTQLMPYRSSVDIRADYYDLLVTDEYPAESNAKVLMINHGGTGIKTFGRCMENPYITDKDSRLITCATTSSKHMIDIVAKECGIDQSRVFPTGLPRTDAYYNKQKGDGFTFLSGKRAYLYVPTWRRPDEVQMPKIDWQFIDNNLSDDEVLVVKPHMLSEHVLNREYKHITELFSDVCSTPYLIDCDVVITDYSSIMFDAMVLNKPLILFDKSVGYLDTRGTYFKYPDKYSSWFCTDEVSLLELMRSANEPDEVALACRDFTMGACDGHSTQRVIELIRSML